MIFVNGTEKEKTLKKNATPSSITSILSIMSQDFLWHLHANVGIVYLHLSVTIGLQFYNTSDIVKNTINQNIINRILTLSHFYYTR